MEQIWVVWTQIPQGLQAQTFPCPFLMGRGSLSLPNPGLVSGWDGEVIPCRMGLFGDVSWASKTFSFQ